MKYGFLYETDAAALAAQDALVRASGEGHYVDSDWGASQRGGERNGLYNDPRRAPVGQAPLDCMVWRRLCVPGAVRGCAPGLMFGGSGEKGSIKQGSLSNRFLIEAMSMCRGAVKANFVGYESSTRRCRQQERGICTLKFWKEGAWRYVHIDDQIPCRFDGKPLYASASRCADGADDGEAWPLLLEKAYAKLHGSYENIGDGAGSVEDAVGDLTSAPPLRLVRGEAWWDFLAKEGKLWAALRHVLALDAGQMSAAGAADVRVADAVGCAIRVAELGLDSSVPSGEGLLADCAYSVTRVLHRSGAPRLVQLRNNCAELPNAAWRGAWCDSDAQWRSAELPECVRELRPNREAKEEEEDIAVLAASSKVAVGAAAPPALPPAAAAGAATMWMTFEDFSARFTSLLLCPGTLRSGWCAKRWESAWNPLPDVAGADGASLVPATTEASAAAAAKEGEQASASKEQEHDGAPTTTSANALRNVAGGCPNHAATWHLNPHFVFDVHPDRASSDPTAPTRLIITVSQRDARWQRALARSERSIAPRTASTDAGVPPLRLGFTVMQLSAKLNERACAEFRQEKCVGMSPRWEARRDVTCELDLFPGRYAIVPSTFESGRAAPFWLDVRYSAGVRIEWRGEAHLTGTLREGPPAIARAPASVVALSSPTGGTASEARESDAAAKDGGAGEAKQRDAGEGAEGNAEASGPSESGSGSGSGSNSGSGSDSDEDSLRVDDGGVEAKDAVGELGGGLAERDDGSGSGTGTGSGSGSGSDDDEDEASSRSEATRSAPSSPTRDTEVDEESSEDEYARAERESKEAAARKRQEEAAAAAAIVASRAQFAADTLPGFVAPPLPVQDVVETKADQGDSTLRLRAGCLATELVMGGDEVKVDQNRGCVPAACSSPSRVRCHPVLRACVFRCPHTRHPFPPFASRPRPCLARPG